jgi:hypothetical protein
MIFFFFLSLSLSCSLSLSRSLSNLIEWISFCGLFHVQTDDKHKKNIQTTTTGRYDFSHLTQDLLLLLFFGCGISQTESIKNDDKIVEYINKTKKQH